MSKGRVGTRFSKEARAVANARRRQGRGAWLKLTKRHNPGK